MKRYIFNSINTDCYQHFFFFLFPNPPFNPQNSWICKRTWGKTSVLGINTEPEIKPALTKTSNVHLDCLNGGWKMSVWINGWIENMVGFYCLCWGWCQGFIHLNRRFVDQAESFCIGLYGHARWVIWCAAADTAFLFIVKVLWGAAYKSTRGGINQFCPQRLFTAWLILQKTWKNMLEESL